MPDHRSGAFDLADTFLHLSDGPAAEPVAVAPDFWETIDQRTELHDGRLVCLVRMAETWPHWEMHPAGDEIVLLLSGSMDLVLDEAPSERVVALRGRSGCVVPQGVWHRGIVHEPGDALFITRGEGTQHRPL